MSQTETVPARAAEIRRLSRAYFLDAHHAEKLLDTAALLRERIAAGEESFPDMLDRLILASGRKASEIYTAAGMDRRDFSKIRKYPAHPVRKNQIVALGLALRLAPEQMEALLKSAGYAFSGSDPADILARFLFEKGIYDAAMIGILRAELGLADDA